MTAVVFKSFYLSTAELGVGNNIYRQMCSGSGCALFATSHDFENSREEESLIFPLAAVYCRIRVVDMVAGQADRRPRRLQTRGQAAHPLYPENRRRRDLRPCLIQSRRKADGRNLGQRTPDREMACTHCSSL